jgi:Reverse transcriptase (RNA-dependent DNA polymerase)/Integrase core domain/GAG-pre-integrase domain
MLSCWLALQQHHDHKCTHCRKVGHTADKCFSNPLNTNTRSALICQACNKAGHTAARCRQFSLQRNANYQGRNNNGNSNSGKNGNSGNTSNNGNSNCGNHSNNNNSGNNSNNNNNGINNNGNQSNGNHNNSYRHNAASGSNASSTDHAAMNHDSQGYYGSAAHRATLNEFAGISLNDSRASLPTVEHYEFAGMMIDGTAIPLLDTQTVIDQQDYHFISLPAHTLSQGWLFDTGAMSCITNDLSDLTAVRSSAPGHYITGIGGKIQVVSIGSMHAHITNDKGTTTNITLTDVRYVPLSPGKMLTMGALSKLQVTATIDGAVAVLKGNDFTYSTARDNATGYCMVDLKVNAAADFENEAVMLAASENQLELWHRRLGHANVGSVVDQLKTQNIRLQHSQRQLHSLTVSCVPCHTGKAHHVSLPKVAAYDAKEPFELVMTDGFGPVPPSLSGRRYAQLLVDVHTRHAWVYFVHHQSDALSVIESFLLYVVKARGKRMLLLRADNAKEFKSAALAKLLSNFGSRQQFSAPYTPQQNGMVERYWRTAAESARAMLIESRLGDEYWCLAFRHVVYIRNRLHAAALPRGVTPYFRLNGQHANIKFMRVWGSPIHVYTERRFRDSKFSPSAKAGILVGYDEASHCSLVYMPDERKIVSSIHVHVDESSVRARTVVTLTPGTTTAITAPSNTIIPPAATATLPTTSSTTVPATSTTTPVSPGTTSSTTETAATTETPNSTGNTTITAADTITLTSPSSTTNRVTAADTITPVSPSNTNNTTVTAADTITPASLSNTGNTTVTAADTITPTSLSTTGNTTVTAADTTTTASPHSTNNTTVTNANTIAPTSTYATRSTVATSDDNASIPSGTTAASPVKNNTNSDSAHTTAAAGVKARRVRTSTKHFDEQYHYYETMIDEEIGLVAARVQAGLLHYCTVGAKQAAIDECFASLDAAAASDNPTHKAAMNGPDAARWLAAIDAEIKAQIDNGTWDLVSLPIEAHAIGSKFVLRVKYNADGSLDKLKARLVAQGFTQVEGKDYFEHEVFAPTVRFSSLRVLFVLII